MGAKRTDRDECVLDVPVFTCHPEVLAAKERGEPLPAPISFYLDGVAFVAQAAGRSETVLGFWCQNLISGKKTFHAQAEERGHLCLRLQRMVQHLSNFGVRRLDVSSGPTR
jgi:hypothetical protein